MLTVAGLSKVKDFIKAFPNLVQIIHFATSPGVCVKKVSDEKKQRQVIYDPCSGSGRDS